MDGGFSYGQVFKLNGRPLLTPLGFGVGVGAIAAFAPGWWLGWVEFSIVSIGCILALLVAMPFILGGHELELKRSVDPQRVEVGGVATSVLTVRNTGTRATAPRTIEDRIGTKIKMMDVPGLAPQAQSEAIMTLPTDQRGVIDVGPAVVTKGDPLGLMRRDLGRSSREQLLVHPRFVPLAPVRSGFVKDLEGPTYDNSPAGDIAFHAVREYSPGDDVRHIHWMSTARTGSLMVRQYVDNRRPYIGVLVDADSPSLTPDQFEVALQIVASQAVSADLDGRPVAAWVGSQVILSSDDQAGRNGALDRLCVSVQDNQGQSLGDLHDRMRLVDREISTLVLVTGAAPPDELLPLVSTARRKGSVLVFRIVDDCEPPVGVPGARVFDVADLEGFASAWRAVVR